MLGWLVGWGRLVYSLWSGLFSQHGSFSLEGISDKELLKGETRFHFYAAAAAEARNSRTKKPVFFPGVANIIKKE